MSESHVEKIECVVSTPVELSGLHKTIALLKSFETVLDRVTGKTAKLSAVGPADHLEGIRQQLNLFQKAGSHQLKPTELNKLFTLGYDKAKLDRELDAFVADLKAQGKRVRDIF